MNKKIKRIGKTVLTFALVLTMLFGQLPSGLVLNSLAAPEETSEPSSENPGKGKDYSAGVSSIVDAPQDTSEVTSEEDSEEEDESESAPETVSDDSNLTSEVNADSETVIKEETNSDSAQDENNQDDNKQDDNKEDSSASEEAEVVSENPSEQISAEVPSEKEEISETPSENTSDANEPEIKDASGEKKSIISGIVEPFRDFGFIFFDIDFEGFEETLGEPDEYTVGFPKITPVDGADFTGVYNTQGTYNISGESFIVAAPEGATYGIEVYDLNSIEYALNTEETVPNAGAYIIKATVTCVGDYHFADGTTTLTQDITGCEYTITSQRVRLNSISIDGNRDYEKGNNSIPSTAISYGFLTEGGETIAIEGAGGIVFTLNSDTANTYTSSADVNPDTSGWIEQPDNGNYQCDLPDPLPLGTVNFTVNKLEISIVFSNEISKQSSLDNTLPKADVINKGLKVKDKNNLTAELKNKDSDDSNWNWTFSSCAIPKNGVAIDGINSSEDFIIKDNGDDVTVNYTIKTDELKGNITPKRKQGTYYSEIDLKSKSSEEYDVSDISDGLTIEFNQINSNKTENEFWFGKEKNGDILTSSNVKFYTYDKNKNSLSDKEATLSFKESHYDDKTTFKDLVFECDGIYYGPIDVIAYAYDATAPTIDSQNVPRQSQGENSIYNISNMTVNDSESTIDKKGLFKTDKDTIITLADIVDDKYGEDDLSNSITIKTSELENFSIWIYARDFAGNRSLEKVDAENMDGNAPSIAIYEEEVDEVLKPCVTETVKEEFEGKKYLSNVSFRLDVKDEGTNVSGLDSVTVYVLDGTDNVIADRLISSPALNRNHSWISPDGLFTFSSDYYGYQLHFLIEAKDYNNNYAYAKAYWKDNGEIVLTNITEEGNKQITDKTSVTADITETFAIVGEGDNSPEISVDFTDDNYIEKDEDGVYQFHTEKRNATVNIKKMAIDSIEFVSANGVIGNNNGSFSLEYVPGEHSYKYKGNANNWEFGNRPQRYSISLKSSKPDFVAFNINECNKQFVVNFSTPDVKIEMDNPVSGSDLNPPKYYTFEGENYTVAKVTVTDENLPTLENFKTKFVTVTYENPSQSDPVYKTDWAENPGGGYYAEFYFKNEGKSLIKVEALNKAKAKGTDQKEFIIDNTSPIFDIKYDGETNVIGDKYYYGLRDGLTKTGEDFAADIKVEITITEANILKEDVQIQIEKDGVKTDLPEVAYTGEQKPNKKDNKGVFSFTIPGEDNDGTFNVIVNYQDPAKHNMTSTVFPVVNGEYAGTERTDIIDTTRPVATYNITEITSENGISYALDADYYRTDFDVEFAIDDANYDDSYTTFFVNKNNEDPVAPKNVYQKDKKSFLYTVTGEDSTYTFTLQEKSDAKIVTKDEEGNEVKSDLTGASDLAGNIMEFIKGKGTTSNDPETDAEEAKPGKYTTGRKIIDKTCPKVELVINPSEGVSKADLQNISDNNRRYFFNKAFNATFTIEETNYDYVLIDPMYSHRLKVECGDYSVDDASDKFIVFENKDDNKESNSKVFSKMFGEGDDTEKTDGLYLLTIAGTDKAGNGVVLSPNCIDENGNPIKPVENKDPIKSYIIVVDKETPELSIKIDDFFEGKLDKTDLHPTKNMPYQKKDNATITFKETTDLSPVKLSYTIGSTKDKIEFASSKYVKSYVKEQAISGQQIFTFDSIKVEDMAGNEIHLPAQTNRIYLDILPPNIDEFKPTISTEIITDGSGRDPKNNPLYGAQGDDYVEVRAIITDPHFQSIISSSGLYKVYYSIFINGKDVSGKESCRPRSVSQKGDTSKLQEITYGDGSGFDWKDEYTKNKDLCSQDTLIFHFNKGEFNYNDIKIQIWAEDNAGNKSSVSECRFGIDISRPKISVSYSNNNAQNGKYFKDPRTATIRVSERNFNPSNTHINTESAAHVSGWSYSQGSSGDFDNGDDDTWTAYVTYDTDGDYTLSVSATDKVGNNSEGVSWNDSVAPTEFTIDLTRPTINVSFDNNRVSNGRYYNANRRATIDINEHNFDTKDVTVERTASIAEGHVNVPGVGNWNRINDVNRTDVYFGQDGDYSMKVDYVDLAGNVAETYVVDTFTIDTVAPDLEIGGVEDKHAYNAKVEPSITYHDINFDKNSANISITGYNHPKGVNLEPGPRSSADRFGETIIYLNLDEVRDNDDIYTAKATISDLAGNTTEKEVTFSVNRFGSTYRLSKDTQDYLKQYYQPDGIDLEITEINVNELSSYSVSYTKDGNLYNLTEDVEYSVEKSNPGWWQYDYHISDVKNFGDDSTNEGTYVVTLSSVDGASNKNSNRAVQETKTETNEFPIEFVIDHTAPQVVFTGVEDNGRYRANERTIMIRYEDKNSYVESMKIYNGEKLVQEYDAKQLSEKGGEIQFNAGASNNWQELKVEVTDAAGNMSPYESGRFLLTSNVLAQYLHSLPLVLATIGGVVLLIGVIIVILILRRRKRY